MERRPLTFGSLFAGIGGIDLGLERAGMRCAFQVEIDPFCRKVLAKHWPRVKQYEDIRKLTGSEAGYVDVLAGGFPCQDLSQAGKRAGLDGDRSGLWFEFARLIGEIRPRWVVAENVAGLLTMPGAMGVVTGELARLGYVGLNVCLRASDFGASHLRKRVFVVAYAGHEQQRPSGAGGQWTPERPGSEVGGGTNMANASRYARNGSHGQDGARRGVCETGDVLADAGDGQLSQPGRGSQGRNGPGPAGPHMDDAERSGLEVRDGQREQYSRQDAEPFAPGPSDARWPAILRERPDLAPALESPLRGMADGIPTDMDRALMDRTKRLKALGNAVVPQVAQWIGERIVEACRPVQTQVEVKV